MSRKYTRKGPRSWGSKFWRNSKKALGSPASQAIVSTLSAGAVKLLKNRLGLNTESKWLDTTQSGTTTGTAVNTTYFMTVPEGNTANSRNGDSFRLAHCNSKLLLTASSAATSPALVRVIFYTQPVVQTIITPTDILQDPTNIITPYNMDSEGFKVLYDKSFSLGPFLGATPQKLIKFKYNPLDHHVKWTTADTTGVSTALTAGYLRCCIFTSATLNFPTFNQYTRIHFVDN